jgi:hypothetical protein
MSDLANSCEHLSIEKQCAAIIDNPKAQVTRELKCLNQEKTACCYLCTYRQKCVINCKYLGQTDNYSYANQKIETTNNPVTEEKTNEAEVQPIENVPVTFCFSCNTEMAWTKTRFAIEGWNGPKPLQVNDNVLPVTIYLCPKCGKIEFHANQKLSGEA